MREDTKNIKLNASKKQQDKSLPDGLRQINTIEATRELIASNRRTQLRMIALCALLSIIFMQEFPLWPLVAAIVYSILGWEFSQKEKASFTMKAEQLEQQAKNLQGLIPRSWAPAAFCQFGVVSACAKHKDLRLPLLIIQILGILAQCAYEWDEKKKHVKAIESLSDNIKSTLSLAHFNIETNIQDDVIEIKVFPQVKRDKLFLDMSYWVVRSLAGAIFNALQKKCVIAASENTLCLRLSRRYPVGKKAMSVNSLSKAFTTFKHDLQPLRDKVQAMEDCLNLLWRQTLKTNEITYDDGKDLFEIKFDKKIAELGLQQDNDVYTSAGSTVSVKNAVLFKEILSERQFGVAPKKREQKSEDENEVTKIVVGAKKETGVLLRPEEPLVNHGSSVARLVSRDNVSRHNRYQTTSLLSRPATLTQPSDSQAPADEKICFGEWGTYDPSRSDNKIIRLGTHTDGITYYILVKEGLVRDERFRKFIEQSKTRGKEMPIASGSSVYGNVFNINPGLSIKKTGEVVLSKIKHSQYDARPYAVRKVVSKNGNDELHLVTGCGGHNGIFVHSDKAPAANQIENEEKTFSP